MAAAAYAFPAGYDWRNQAVSALLYPNDDPGGYLWACAGLEGCAIAGMVWTTELKRRLEARGAEPPWPSPRILRLGFLCMGLAALPDRLLPLPKGHELFAIVAFLGIGIGLIHQMFMVGRRGKSSSPGALKQRSVLIGTSVLLAPLALAGLTAAYLALVRLRLPWISPAWQARPIPAYLSFGAWEWASCLVLSLCLLVLWHYGRAGN
jgi:hypothetical protein